MARDIQTAPNYYDDPGNSTLPAPVVVGTGTVTNRRKTVSVPVTIQDVTGCEDGEFTLDTCGFQYVHYPSQAGSCRDEGYRDVDKIKSDYYPECETVLKEATGADRVFIFNHRVRRGPSDGHTLGPGNADKRGPLHRVHVDQSYRGAAYLLQWHFGHESEKLLARRWQIINLWRPIRDIDKDPLAVADARSVAENDLSEALVVAVNHERRTWAVKQPPTQDAHKWYYKYRQTPDEVTLIKCFDSIDDGSVARRTPHSAFRDAGYDDGRPRESIEIRALVLF